MSTGNEVATAGNFSLQPTSLQEAIEYSKLIASSDFIPNEFKGKPENVLVATQMGSELGLKPLQSLQNIAVINGKPVVWGDAMIAIVRSRKDCECIKESLDETTMTAYCEIKRKGQPPEKRSFSQADATVAGLWGKNTWAKYPKRMLQMRARAFALRDVFGDALKGFSIREEVEDYEINNVSDQAAETTTESEQVMYSAEDFDKNFPTWETAIKASKTTAAAMIKKIESKGKLSEEQMQRIEEVSPEEVIDAEEVKS